MKTRVKTLAVIILILVVLVAACFAAFIIKDSGKYEYGSVDINTIAKDSDSIVIEAASFSVSAGRLWETAQMDIGFFHHSQMRVLPKENKKQRRISMP